MILALNFSGIRTSWVCLKGSGLKFISIGKPNHLFFAKSLCRSLAVAFRSWTIGNREVSWGKSFGFVIKLSDKSLMYIRKNNGLNAEVWGTPASILLHKEYFPLKTTLCFLFDKKSIIKFRCHSYGGELAWLGGLAHLGEMIFIPRLYGIFYLNSIKKFVILLEKTVWSNSLREQWHKAIMQNKCSYNKAKLIKENSILPYQAGPLAHVYMENFHLT